MKKWTPYEEYLLTDLLFETTKSYAEIAKELRKSDVEVKNKIKALGLEWVKKNRKRSVSRGQSALTSLFEMLFPGQKIVNEHQLGDKLRLDVYCPKYKIAAEYNGQQHYEFNSFFHGNKQDFIASVDRDDKKIEMCHQQGITLVVFRFNDALNEQTVYDRIMDALDSPDEEPIAPAQDDTIESKDNTYYEAMKQRRREWNRKQYREMKRRRSGT